MMLKKIFKIIYLIVVSVLFLDMFLTLFILYNYSAPEVVTAYKQTMSATGSDISDVPVHYISADTAGCLGWYNITTSDVYVSTESRECNFVVMHELTHAEWAYSGYDFSGYVSYKDSYIRYASQPSEVWANITPVIYSPITIYYLIKGR